MLGPISIFNPKVFFGTNKKFGLKSLGPKICLICNKKIFGPKKVFGPEEHLESKNTVCPKDFWVQMQFCVRKKMYPKLKSQIWKI